jgi:nitrite reductase (NADH) large subunit
VIFDLETRQKLLDRLEEALASTKDPWKEIVENKGMQEKFFTSLQVKVPVNR